MEKNLTEIKETLSKNEQEKEALNKKLTSSEDHNRKSDIQIVNFYIESTNFSKNE